MSRSWITAMLAAATARPCHAHAAQAPTKLRVGKAQAQSLRVRAGRRRHRDRHLQEARHRRRDQRFRRRRAHAAGAGGGRHRHRARRRPGAGLHRQGRADQGVAAIADGPRTIMLVVLKDGPVKTDADLKGKNVSVSTAGSLTYWLVQELSRPQGLGPGRHQDRAARHRDGADRGAQDPADRRRDHRDLAPSSRSRSRRGPHPGALRRPHQGFPRPRDLRDQQG